MKLIVGLGNPGIKYQWTRHNVGFMALAALAKADKAEFHKCSVSDAQVVKVTIGKEVCILSLPMTYMNNSGLAVKAQAAKAGIAAADILVVYDDMAIKFGHMRLRPEGSAGGHNGMKSIIEHLGTNSFSRLRLGVGRPPHPRMDAADYVLSNFTPAEKKILPDIINQACLCVHSWVNEGVEHAMSQFNKRDNQRNTHE